MASCEDLVADFCNSLAWDGADTEVVAYLASAIQDAEDGGDVDLDELADLVQGFFLGFAALALEEQHDRLWNLVEQVRCNNGFLITLELSLSRQQQSFCLIPSCPGPAAPPSCNRACQQQRSCRPVRSWASRSQQQHLTSLQVNSFVAACTGQSSMPQSPSLAPSALDVCGRPTSARDGGPAAAECAPASGDRVCDEDHDALDLLARICPPDVVLDDEFLRHVLHAKGMGSPEVHFCRTTDVIRIV